MDPNETMAIILDETTEDADRLEAAIYLLMWLLRDGFKPSNAETTRSEILLNRSLDALYMAEETCGCLT